MKATRLLPVLGALVVAVQATAANADWSFSATPQPNAFIQSNNMTLELQCDRIRFAPASWEDAQDIERKQGLSFRFLKNGATESAAFQAGPTNSSTRIVDNYPVEIAFQDKADYEFILEQLARNAAVNLSMTDQDVTYGIFDLKGSGAAIKKLKAACGSSSTGSLHGGEAPEGVVYCGGGQIKRQIEFVIIPNAPDKWDARVTVNGDTIRAMTSYSYFGNSPAPKGFAVALLGEDRSEFLVFSDGADDWLEFGDYTYRKCN
jgi:hypothetical protein